MARQVLPIVGAVIGAYFGNPQLGYAIGAIVGNAVDPQVIKGPKIGDAGVQTSAEGVFRPIIYGTGAVMGNVIARGNRQIRVHRERQGKGGPVTEEERVYWTFAIRICEGPIAGVARIWEDEKLVYDARLGSTIPDESEQFASRFRLYLGDETQLPDPDLEAFQGVGNTPAYRGTCYIVFPNYDLTDRRESIPNYRFEVASEATVSGIDQWVAGPVTLNGAAGGPATYIRMTEDVTDWYGPTGSIIPFPSGLSTLTRISSANRLIFLHGSVTSKVSADRGLTWQNTSQQLSGEQDVFYNGAIYVCRGLYSSDGVTWNDLPNLDSGTYGTVAYSYAREFDRAVIVVHNFAGDIRFTYNNGTTWTNRKTPSSLPVTSSLRGYGMRVFTTVGVFPWHSDDLFNTWEIGLIDTPGAGVNEQYVSEATGLIIAKGTGTRVMRSQDSGLHYEQVEDFDWGSGSQKTFDTDGNVWVGLDRVDTGSPNHWDIRISEDGGESWPASGDTLYGSLQAIAKVQASAVVLPGMVSLASIVEDMHDRVGQDASNYDTSELDEQIEGLVVAGDYTAADVIRTLMPVYYFDASEFDAGLGYRIHYRLRGKPVVASLTIDDFVSAPEKTTREDAYERPKVLHMHYQNPSIGYAPAKASIMRFSQDVKVTGEVSTQIPVTISDVDEAAQRASVLMKVTWVEVGGLEDFVVTDKLLHLVPGDCVAVTLRGQTRRMRIVEQYVEDGRLPLKLIPDRQSSYTSEITGTPVPPPTPPLPSISGPSIAVTLDIPALVDSNDVLGFYRGVTGQSEAWYGAADQLSTDGGANFETVTTFNQGTVMGFLLNTVSDASEFYPDNTNTVLLQLYRTSDDVESLTEQEFLSEGGAFALQNDDGSWEIMQYQDADDQGGGTFELSRLARGRLNSGTEEHTPGAVVVFLDLVRMVQVGSSLLNQDLTHRAVSLGTSPESATQETQLFTGKSQIEFPVAQIVLESDGTTLDARAVPRHRFGTELNPVRSVNWSGYRWSVTDGSNTINRTGTSDNESFNVSGWASPITVTVSQLNRITGAGPSVSEQIA